MGKMLERREARVRSLVSLAMSRFDEGLGVEEVEESVRRYILVHYGGTHPTVDAMATETMAKVEYEREKKLRLQV